LFILSCFFLFLMLLHRFYITTLHICFQRSAKLAELQSKARRANDKRVKAQFDVNETSMKLGHLRADAARATQDLETRCVRVGVVWQNSWI